MSLIMTVITSRRDVGLTMCSYQCPIIELGSALILIVTWYTIFHPACGMLKTRVPNTRILLDRRSILV